MNFKSIFAPGLFHGKSAIVTGGATGIGRAIAIELAALGCHVTIASRKEESLKKACQEINPFLAARIVKHMEFKTCNIRKEEEVVDLISHVVERDGKVDILVNNGGGQFPSQGEDIKLKGWNAVIETNLTGTFLCTREVFKQSMKQHGGAILNIIMDIYKGFPGMSHSAAARSGVETMSKSLAVEWAQHGVTVNCIAPGIIFSETAAANYGDAGYKMFVQSSKNVPHKRLGVPEEIACAACYLLSPGAAYVTGQTLYVDGGISLYSPQKWDVPDHDKSVTFSWGAPLPPKPKL